MAEALAGTADVLPDAECKTGGARNRIIRITHLGHLIQQAGRVALAQDDGGKPNRQPRAITPLSFSSRTRYGKCAINRAGIEAEATAGTDNAP